MNDVPTEMPIFRYDIWHPLDHWPWESRCKEFYGGWRIHLKYWWEEYFLNYWLGAHILIAFCRIGVHDWGEVWYPPKGGWPRLPNGMPDIEQVAPTIQCRRCWRKKP